MLSGHASITLTVSDFRPHDAREVLRFFADTLTK